MVERSQSKAFISDSMREIFSSTDTFKDSKSLSESYPLRFATIAFWFKVLSTARVLFRLRASTAIWVLRACQCAAARSGSSANSSAVGYMRDRRLTN